MDKIQANKVFEFSVTSSKPYADPYNEIKLTAVFTAPDGVKKELLFFWCGKNSWKVRYSSPILGIHTFITVCSDNENKDLEAVKGSIEVTPYTGGNALYKKGAPVMSENKKYLVHSLDSSPFFWMADTWWMGLTKRLEFEGFKTMTADRAEKGFNVVKMVMGLYPDMEPFDERGMNEAGFPWDRDYKVINPEYFDAAEKKIFYLIENGITPCLVGCWGFFVPFIGVGAVKRHWEYIIARFASYPVIWCGGGEANMMYYLDHGKISHEEHLRKSRTDWTDIMTYIKETDKFGRLLTIHPTQNGHDQINDESLLGLDMLQTGHHSFLNLLSTVKQVKAAVDRKAMPVINDEVCYEGISGSSGADVQRYLFWTNIIVGACGHTYGANGIWQVNSKKQPYGPSPHGSSWGDTPWEDAMNLPGSFQVGAGAKVLRTLPWEKFELHQEWLASPCSFENFGGGYCAGVPGECRVIFLPYFGGFFWGDTDVLNVEADTYKALWFDPVDGKTTELGDVIPNESGVWRTPKVKKFQDWVVILIKKA